MYITFGTPRSIHDLNTASYQLSKPRRIDIPIIMIDDEEVPHLEEIRHHGFNLSHFKEIEQIDSLSAFEIVLCDIRGIGKKFQSKYEGAHVISEIRRVYPFKIIIAYSAYTFDPSYNKFFRLADDILKKDLGIDEWVERLDGAIELAINPVLKWEKIKLYLQSQKIGSIDLVKLEDEYVRLFEKKIKIGSFPSKKVKNNLNEEAKQVLQSFLTSMIFKLI
jgi:hypothetical protein